ncbi:hypothetical protein Mapa_002996 [Marchantia paleacea]|nr:hypothetical protein Mapa_002996 [Marchantia paleacea]
MVSSTFLLPALNTVGIVAVGTIDVCRRVQSVSRGTCAGKTTGNLLRNRSLNWSNRH